MEQQYQQRAQSVANFFPPNTTNTNTTDEENKPITEKPEWHRRMVSVPLSNPYVQHQLGKSIGIAIFF